jgi:lysophospholipase L1-like esterase
MKILAIGDSFTYGSELPDATTVVNEGPKLLYTQPSKSAWPTLLANLLNGSVTNLGLPGSGNDRIFKLAIDKTINNSYDLVICAWSYPSRLDVIYDNVEIGITPNSTWFFRYKELVWAKDYYKFIHNNKVAYLNTFTKIIALQSYFKVNNQRYIFLNVEPWVSKLVPSHLANAIDADYYIGWPNLGMVDWMGDAPKGTGGHPLELGHERIANKIYEHIGNLSWLP